MNKIARRWIVLLMLVALAPVGGCRSGPATGTAARQKPYQASSLREPYHRADCRWAAEIDVRHRRGYDTPEQAEMDGHRPCRVCRPDSASQPAGP